MGIEADKGALRREAQEELPVDERRPRPGESTASSHAASRATAYSRSGDPRGGVEEEDAARERAARAPPEIAARDVRHLVRERHLQLFAGEAGERLGGQENDGAEKSP
jgi:hypothetical protein